MSSALLILHLALAQSAPSAECRQVREVGTLARKHRLDDSTLRALETRYCSAGAEQRKSKAPPPPSSVAGKSAECIEAMMLEQLAGFDVEKEAGDESRELRERLCKSRDAAGEVRYGNGRLARSSTGVWNYPSGKLARRLGGPWLYPSGAPVRQADGPWNYPNGGTARYSDGGWKAPQGVVTTLEGLLTQCRSAGGCTGGARTPAKGAEDVFHLWLMREVWAVLPH